MPQGARELHGPPKVGSRDIDIVGGKKASLGELLSGLKDAGVRVPDGFAVTSGAYREYVRANGLEDRDFARFLVEAGIDSIALNPGSVVGVKRREKDPRGHVNRPRFPLTRASSVAKLDFSRSDHVDTVLHP